MVISKFFKSSTTNLFDQELIDIVSLQLWDIKNKNFDYFSLIFKIV